jgi:hypothetical protein
LKKWARGFAKKVRDNKNDPAWQDSQECKDQFVADCRRKKWKDADAPANPDQGTPNGMSPDHVHDVGLGGPCEFAEMKDGLKWVNSQVNQEMGTAMKDYDPAVHGNTVKAAEACKCG